MIHVKRNFESLLFIETAIKKLHTVDLSPLYCIVIVRKVHKTNPMAKILSLYFMVLFWRLTI